MDYFLYLVGVEGAFGVLFCALLYWTIKDSRQREDRYKQMVEENQKIIFEQAKAFQSISKDVTEIKDMVQQTRRRTS